MATLWGMTALRLANAQIYPFDYEAYAGEIGTYVKEIAGQGESPISPDLDLLVGRIKRFQENARELNGHIDRLLSREGKISSGTLQAINAALMQAERDFGFPGGIPKRPWFKHLIYACKFTYDPEVLPGLTEAVEEKDWARAKEQIALLAQAVSRADRTLQEVLTKVLKISPVNEKRAKPSRSARSIPFKPRTRTKRKRTEKSLVCAERHRGISGKIILEEKSLSW